MSKDLLLIHPPYHRRRGSGVIFPLGLGYLAAVTRVAGFSCQVLDLAATTPSLEPEGLESAVSFLTDQLLRDPPRLAIGLGPTTTSAVRSLAPLVEACHSIRPSTPVILGGPLASIPGQEWLFFNEVHADAVVVGDGETVLIALMEHLDKGGHISECGSVLTRSGGEIFPSPENLDGLPLPARDYLEDDCSPYHLSLRRAVDVGRFATIMASRGCPYNCSFCLSGNQKSGGYRRRSSASIAHEMRDLQTKHRVEHCVFYDDCFFPSKTSLEADIISLGGALDQFGVSATWQMEMRPDVANGLTENLVQRLHQAGCRQINLGVETGSAAYGELIGKTTDPDRITRTCRIIREASDIVLSATFILGGPGETEASVTETVAYSEGLGLHFAHFYPLELYPSTPLFESLYGDQPSRWWYDMVMADPRPWGELIYSSVDLPSDRLLELTREAYRRFYGRSDWKHAAQSRFGIRYAQFEQDLAGMVEDRFGLGQDMERTL